MPSAPLLHLPDNVIADVYAYGNELGRFAANQITPIEFKVYRVHMGVYEQRTKGRFMVRVRVGAGALTSAQARKVAAISQKYGDSILHFTTRQDVQIHGVALADTPAVHEGLLEVGLAARGGGGNTVRNICTPARAGVEPGEAFDVRPYAIATAEYLLQFHDSYELPRKYKIAFCATDNDEVFASVTDLGFFALKQGEKTGFRVFAGGGQGGSPRPGLLIHDWLETGHVLHMAEAIKRIFERHGNRENKHAARLRFVVGKFGEEGFVRLCRNELDDIIRTGLPGNVPEIREIPAPDPNLAQVVNDPRLLPDKTPGLYSIRLNLHLGNIHAQDLARLADLAENTAEGMIRASCKQDLYISSLPGDQAISMLEKTHDLAGRQQSIVACAGASTCNLGLCLSRGLATAVTDAFSTAGLDPDEPEIRISGCPNSCGNHHSAPIGFSGRAKTVNGRKMPYYDVWAGAVLGDKGATLARRLGAIPARRIPDMLVNAYKQAGTSPEQLRELVEKYENLPDPVPEEYFYDWGSDTPFSLDGLGPGQCSASLKDAEHAGNQEQATCACSCACDPATGCCTEQPLDLRSVKCPMNFAQARVALANLAIGGILELVVDPGEPARNISASFTDHGQEVLSSEEEDSAVRIRIKRRT